MREERYRTEQDLVNKIKHLIHVEYEHETHGFESEEQMLCMVIAHLMAEEILVKALTVQRLTALIAKGLGPVDTEEVALNWLSNRYGSLRSDMAYIDPDNREDAMHKSLYRLILKVEFFPYENIEVTK
jgi:hypothetical protein